MMKVLPTSTNSWFVRSRAEATSNVVTEDELYEIGGLWVCTIMER